MLRRKVTDKLINWKNNRDRKCLVLRGARQIGKTFSVRRFAEENFDVFVEINFLMQPSLKDIFKGNLDIDTLLLTFSVYLPDVKFIPGKTLLFLDEIQECPEAITSLKFWKEDGRFCVIASGSMLGIDYKRPTSYPVGAIEYIDMHPLDFKEFLWASGISDEILHMLRNCFDTFSPVAEPIHKKMMELLRTYLVTGGMPDVVNAFFTEKSVAAADQKQRDILKDYRYDIAHYAKAEDKIKAEKCFFSIAEQLSKENHKFQYSIVEKGGNARKYKNSVDWLSGAFLAYRCINVSKMSMPLESYGDETNFRLYPSDIGLLTGMFDYSLKSGLLSGGVQISHAKGGIYEALVADMLIKNGHDKLYFRRNEQATFEIEFLLETDDGVIPLEVKAGNSRSRSLDSMLKKDEFSYGYKLIGGNVGKAEKKITLPLYMGMFL